jgi:hypothetical protein
MSKVKIISGVSAGRMLFDGASMVSFQGETLSMLDYLTPYDLDFQVVDIDLSKLNKKDPEAIKPVIVFDRAPAKVTLGQSKKSLPDSKVDTIAISKKVHEYIQKWLGIKTQEPNNNANSVRINSASDIEVIGRASPNWAPFIPNLNEDRHMFKAVSLYILEYLFKTRAGGYFLALSGGSDSTLNALFIYFACQGLSYFAYQAPNHEIIHKISYVLGLPITLKKVSLSLEEQKKQFFLSGDQIINNPNDYILSQGVGDVKESDSFQYFLDETTPITPETISNKILNAAYLPMDFSGITKPFVEQLNIHLNCNFVEFSIQGPFNAFKQETERILEK